MGGDHMTKADIKKLFYSIGADLWGLASMDRKAATMYYAKARLPFRENIRNLKKYLYIHKKYAMIYIDGAVS